MAVGQFALQHLRGALQRADLCAQVWQRAQRLLLVLEPCAGPGHDGAILGFDEYSDLLQKDDQRVRESFKIFSAEVFVLSRIDNGAIECGQRVVITLIGLLTVAC